MVHARKIAPEYLSDIQSGKKTFEIRLEDSACPFAVGDFLALNEHTDADGYSDNSAIVEIRYIVRDPSVCKPGYAVLGVHRCALVTDTPAGDFPSILSLSELLSALGESDDEPEGAS